MMRYVLEDASAAIVAPAEGAFRDGTLSSLYGLDVMVDWGAGSVTDTAFKVYAGVRNRTLVYANQFSKTERMRHNGRFASRYRTLATYGVMVAENRSLYALDVTVKA